MKRLKLDGGKKALNLWIHFTLYIYDVWCDVMSVVTGYDDVVGGIMC